MIGKTLAHYEILDRIGAGGMGEVYLARDTELGRNVAIKVLPSGIARDPARLERFEREARALAALNHPNIVTVHSVESDGDVRFLTMELLEGTTLAKLVDGGGLPLERFLGLAIPLADALAAAHAKGITHRDLKPSNVMVDSRGVPKVLDFGLAKLGGDDGGTADGLTAHPTETVEEPLTGEGRVVGTAAYMSPEQAEGKAVDSRSDIFSLGIVLYEMATGVRPFRGDTPVSTISSILRDTPTSITELNRVLPRELGRIVTRCLAKDPDRRFQTALDVRNELQDLKRDVDSGDLARAESPVPPRRPWTAGRLAAAAGFAIVVAAATLGLYLWATGSGKGKPAAPLSVKLTRLTASGGDVDEPSISPDGRMVAYVATGGDDKDIFLQRARGSKAINLTADCDQDDAEPAFSPDGGRIAFRSERDGGGIFVMGATGESPRRLTSFGHFPTWSPDGTRIVFGTQPVSDPRMGPDAGAIWTVNVETGDTRKVLDAAAENPSWSPHGERIAYWAVTGGQRDIWTVRPDGTDPARVTDDEATDWRPIWSPDGSYLFFCSDRGGADNVWRVPVAEATGRASGPPEQVTTGTSSVGSISMTRDGRRLASSVYSYQGRLERIGFDPEKAAVVGEPVAIIDAVTGVPAYSPDGRSIAYMSMGRREDLFVVRADGTGLVQLTDDPFRDRFPRWSPKGDRIAFFSNRSGKYEIWTIRPDGRDLRQETNVPGQDLIAPVWSADGSRISCRAPDGREIAFDWKENLAAPRGPGELKPLPPFPEKDASFFGEEWSPDGRELAGIAMNTRGEMLGISVFSAGSGRYRDVTRLAKPSDQIGFVWWLAGGRRLLCNRGERLVLVDTATGAKREIRTPKLRPREFTGYFAGADQRSLLRVHGTYAEAIWLIDLEGGR